jgi:hypothetical protein
VKRAGRRTKNEGGEAFILDDKPRELEEEEEDEVRDNRLAEAELSDQVT